MIVLALSVDISRVRHRQAVRETAAADSVGHHDLCPRRPAVAEFARHAALAPDGSRDQVARIDVRE